MQSPRLTGVAVLTALAGFTASPLVFADDSAAAQSLFDQAKKEMAAHDYAEACPKLEESLRLQEAIGTMLNLADCYERAGKLASAWSKYLEVASKARAAGQAARARIGRDRAAALAPKLSSLVVDVSGVTHPDGLEVRRDGTVVGSAEWGVAIHADAGTHTIEASAPGRKPWSQTVVVADGATTARVTVGDLAPLPVKQEELATASTPVEPSSPPPLDVPKEPARTSGLKVAALVAGGLGVVGVGLGTAFGLISRGDHDDAVTACPPPGPCANTGGADLWRKAYDFGNASTVAFVVGGVGLAAGTVMWVVAVKTSKHKDASAALVVGPGSVGWREVW
jgi:hypothetical protein